MSDLLLFIFDVVIIILLSVVIYYAMALSRRLRSVREARSELEKLSQQFIAATDKAANTIADLKHTADEAGQSLQSRITYARELKSEIEYIVNRADALADRLSDGIAGKSSGGKKSGDKADRIDKNDLEKALKSLEEKADEWERDGTASGRGDNPLRKVLGDKR